MTKEEIAKEYFKMHTKIQNERQFNKKVDMNTRINKFKKQYDLVVETNEPIITLFVGGTKIATIHKQYANKKVNGEYKELKKRLLVMEEDKK